MKNPINQPSKINLVLTIDLVDGLLGVFVKVNNTYCWEQNVLFEVPTAVEFDSSTKLVICSNKGKPSASCDVKKLQYWPIFFKSSAEAFQLLMHETTQNIPVRSRGSHPSFSSEQSETQMISSNDMESLEEKVKIVSSQNIYSSNRKSTWSLKTLRATLNLKPFI